MHCIDLGESFPNLQKLASIQPRTSLVKFVRSPRTDPFVRVIIIFIILLQIPQVQLLLTLGAVEDAWQFYSAKSGTSAAVAALEPSTPETQKEGVQKPADNSTGCVPHPSFSAARVFRRGQCPGPIRNFICFAARRTHKMAPAHSAIR